MSFYDTKIIVSKNVVEIWKHSAVMGSKKGHSEGVERRSYDELAPEEKVDSLRRKERYYLQKRHEIKRLVDCNYDKSTKFMTLTFREHITEVDKANYEFKKFIQRLKDFLIKRDKGVLKYLATWERTKKNRIHYHIILFDFPYVEKKYLAEKIWKNGFIKINRLDDLDDQINVGRYVSKYFAKELDMKEHKKKAYFQSRNLNKPVEKRLFLSSDKIEDMFEIDDVVFQKNYTTEYKIDKDVTIEDSVDYYVLHVDDWNKMH